MDVLVASAPSTVSLRCHVYFPSSFPTLLNLDVGVDAAVGVYHLYPLDAIAIARLSGPVLVHLAKDAADAKEEQYKAVFGEACVMDEVCVDHVLQVAAAILEEEHIDDTALGVAAALCGHAVVDAIDHT